MILVREEGQLVHVTVLHDAVVFLCLADRQFPSFFFLQGFLMAQDGIVNIHLQLLFFQLFFFFLYGDLKLAFLDFVSVLE